MAQSMTPYNDYLVFQTSQLQDHYSNLTEERFIENYYPSPIRYQVNGDSDWMSAASSPSSYSAHDYSPPTTNAMPTLNNGFPSNWPIGPTNTPPSQSAKDLQKLNVRQTTILPYKHLTNIPQRRRQQNRESQRAFRQRKNRDLEQLEQALADLQVKHEKLLKCFVGLTAKVSAERLGGLVDDMSFLDEQIKQYNSCLGKDFKINGDRIEAIRAKTENL
ncbi:hypothetical protein ONS95_013604 [Cadophora gregata]|uniref:uncharacterized protein n=1 Tax=Cadophora gregata TaxID=51156 RepID=UPI0026DB0EA4|nr:uncharacterized protein ONS95_013604 [Cadophora gregata]KAK0113350.1 hypothetical protein ONS96_014215 [Cadophora gregata f. sp. sojae]KAK0114100.1 hypothetical protein ONS95_013604 [Cadophora gregata]